MNILVVSRPDYSCIHQLISRIHDFVTVFEATRFFVSNAFFQLSLSVFQLVYSIEPQMLLKSCLFHIHIMLPRHVIFCIFASMSTYRFIYVLFV